MPAFTIDRFEGPDWAVLEDEHALTRTVPRSWIPPGATEGDLLHSSEELPADGSRTIQLHIDPAATADRRRLAQERRDRLPRGPSGDIHL